MEGHALIFRPLRVPGSRRARMAEAGTARGGDPEAAESASVEEADGEEAAAEPTAAAAAVAETPSALDAREDARLVNAVRRGDAQAFDQLVRRHLAVAHRVALRVLNDTHDAQDACQDAFIQALTHLESCERPEAFRAWLLTIVRNRAHNLVKSRRVRATEPLDSVQESGSSRDDPSRIAYQGEVRERIDRALSGLTHIQRTVVVMFDGEGWTHREIAKHLGISEGSSRVHLHVARARLRERLGALNPFGGEDERRR